MFESIQRWLGFEKNGAAMPQHPISTTDSAEPLGESPLAKSKTESGVTHSFICRDVVLSRVEHIEGHVFSLDQKLQTRMQSKSESIQQAYEHGLLINLKPIFTSTNAGQSLAFIHLHPATLKAPLPYTFLNKNVVVMVTPCTLEFAERAELKSALGQLKEIGIKYGVTLDKQHPEQAEIQADADFIEIESHHFDGVQLKALSRKVGLTRGNSKLIASGVENSDDFNLCFQCGFDYFTGPFASNRKNWQPEKSDINRLRVFEILNMIRAGEEFDAIAGTLRTEPVLTFKLLRYINSPSVGLQQKIIDIGQALVVLGRENFHRWLSLMLFDFKKLGYHERVLSEQVLVRARFMEMLAGRGNVPAEPDQLFMTGLFSMLDLIMNQPLDEVLEQVSLPEPVSEALQGKQGYLRNTLKMAIALESGNTEEMVATATECGLNAQEVSGTMVEALSWAELIMREIS